MQYKNLCFWDGEFRSFTSILINDILGLIAAILFYGIYLHYHKPLGLLLLLIEYSVNILNNIWVYKGTSDSADMGVAWESKFCLGNLLLSSVFIQTQSLMYEIW